MTPEELQELRDLVLTYDVAGNECLQLANEAREMGLKARAEKLYGKGQFWLDKSNAIRERIAAVTASN